jgi:hypothetical protein
VRMSYIGHPSRHLCIACFASPLAICRPSIFPPSVHPCGEQVSWVCDGDPADISHEMLLTACRRLAAGCVVIRHGTAQPTWPTLEHGCHRSPTPQRRSRTVFANGLACPHVLRGLGGQPAGVLAALARGAMRPMHKRRCAVNARSWQAQAKAPGIIASTKPR